MIFSSFNNISSSDPNGFQIKPIKYVIDLIAPVLTRIFNVSLTSGTFPSRMQIAKVVPVFKRGDKTNVLNYHPISFLSVFSKDLEKVIPTRLINFAKKHKIIAHFQHGFIKSRSAETALCAQKEFILRNFENKHVVLALFVDFKKHLTVLTTKFF